MDKEYDHITSYHYSQYRPPLHELILEKCIGADKRFNKGLDIGCGTGKSSVALSKYCHQVIGIDPSSQMLQNAITHFNVEYQPYDGVNLNFENQSFDVITFAGSLFYAKSQQLIDEFRRVCKNNAWIIVYDFEIHLNEILEKLTQKIEVKSEELPYNHSEDFSGLNTQGITLQFSQKEDIFLPITFEELTHLLLSSKKIYNQLSNVFDSENLEKKINDSLFHILDNNKITSSIYYSVFEFNK